jgi:hypothetical protein
VCPSGTNGVVGLPTLACQPLGRGADLAQQDTAGPIARHVARR